MIYLNHAATSWPKPAGVQRAVSSVLGGTPDAWPDRFEAGRASIAAHFGIAQPERLLITPSCTAALDIAVASVPLRSGDRVLTTSFEHDALDRAVQLAARRRAVTLQRIAPGPLGALLDPDAYASALAAGGVRLVAMTMASNVTGALLPVELVVRLAREHGALVLLDGAQLAGAHPTPVPDLGADLWAFAGHKGPQGPQGVGGLYVAPEVPLESAPPLLGPGFCDAGSVNLPGLAGLAAGLSWLEGRDAHVHRASLIAQLVAGLRDLGAVIYGPPEGAARAPLVSVGFAGSTPDEVALELRRRQILVAPGRHCAPRAHRALGTHDSGTLRLSVGPQTTSAEIDEVLRTLRVVLG